MAADGLHFAQCMSQLLGAVMFVWFIFPTIWEFSRKGKAQDRDVLWLQILKY